MPAKLWVRVPGMVVWAIAVILVSSAVAHNTHKNPYLDPTAYRDSRLGLRYRIPLGQAEDTTELSDDLAIQIKGGKERAIELAQSYGLEYLDQVFDDPAVFHLRKPRQNRSRRGRSRRETTAREVVEAIASDPEVEWVEQQVALLREKRSPFGKKKEQQNNLYRKFPRDRFVSRQTLRQALQRSLSEPAGRKHFSAEKGRRIDTYLNDDLEVDRVVDIGKRHYFGPSTSSKDKLIRVPLSRSVGYGFKPIRTSTRKQSGNNEDAINSMFSHSPRQRTFRDDVKMVNIPRKDGVNTKDGVDSVKKLENEAVTPVSDDSFGLWLDHLGEPFMDFNDPFYSDQWYLRNTGQMGRDGYDLNVTWAWLNGYTGQGVVLSVLDDGLQTTNADIAENYAPSVSYSLVKDRARWDDPSPRLDSNFSNSHGTYCAGIMAAISNNSVCGVGVAYDSKVGGVRLVDGKVTDVQEATALSRHIDQVDIFSASWGPTDDGTKLEGPNRLARLAFIEGITKGRDGKGTIYVWASGNGGVLGDNCNLDGYASSIYTLSVSALTDLGTSTFYEEPCASTLAAVYVGGEHTLAAAKERKKRNMKTLSVIVPELDGHCNKDFQGTSAAAPLMAGVVALVLQANGNLTWRDTQHLVVRTSEPTPEALLEPGWGTNGRGRKFHLFQGFGAVNAGKMVEAALGWKNVEPQKIIVLPMFSGHRIFHPFNWMNVTQSVDSSDVPSSQRMTSVEHVVANITLVHPRRKLLTIFIVSPSGTTSQVLTHRGPDESKDGFRSWGFMSVHFWGESPEGAWTVAIKDDSGETGYLKKVELTIFGF
ncbi:furin-like protease kpc-1 [Palaemon carinicauda]|uniref:furin-like protease kpc-1 n=1 Tax=Palaemon carinicauda TaxID=392227 RepID=UPI0035B5FFEE